MSDEFKLKMLRWGKYGGALLPSIVAGASSTYKFDSFWWIILASIVNFICMVAYDNMKEKNEIDIDEIKKKYNLKTSILARMYPFLGSLSKSLNDSANSITNADKSKKTVFVPYSKETFCEQSCKMYSGILSNYLNKNSNDVVISYVECLNGYKSMNMVCSSLENDDTEFLNNPTRIGRTRYKDYYIAKAIRDNYRSISVLNGKEIDANFCKLDKKTERNNKKRSQYVLVPVICDKNLIMGYLQIDMYNDTMIDENKEVTKNFLDENFKGCINLILLAYKIDKGLLAIPKVDNK